MDYVDPGRDLRDLEHIRVISRLSSQDRPHKNFTFSLNIKMLKQ